MATAAVVLVVKALLLKTRIKLHFHLHHVAVILAFLLAMVAFPLGL